MVAGDQFLDGEVVAGGRALEAELAAQHVGQQPPVGRGRHPVNLVVGRHHRLDRQRGDGALERREEVFAQRPFRNLGRADIGAVLRLAMAGEVLERSEHLVVRQRQGVALEAADGGDAQGPDQVGIFAVGLLDAAPARVAGDVHHRRQRDLRAPRTHLAGVDREDAGQQFRVPGAGQADGLREAGGLGRDVTVQPLLVHHHRNAEPGVLHRPVLGGVGVVGGLLGAATNHLGGAGRAGPCARLLHGAPVGGAGDLADAVGEVLLGVGKRELTFDGLDQVLVLPDRGHLGDLLVQRHAREQVFDPFLHRLARVLVQGPGRRSRRGRLGGRRQGGGGHRQAKR